MIPSLAWKVVNVQDRNDITALMLDRYTIVCPMEETGRKRKEELRN